MLKAFNHWYDRQEEPYRFFLFVVIMMGWLPFMYASSTVLLVIGACWLCTAAIVGISRI
jgi:hypothetical protein